jgi:hypothetical protein
VITTFKISALLYLSIRKYFFGAALLLLLELALRGCWRWAFVRAFILLTLRVLLMLLIGEGSKGSQSYGGGTERPRCKVSCLGSLCCYLALDVDLEYFFMRAQGNPHVLLHCFFTASPISSTARRVVALGLLGRRPILPGASALFFYLRPGLDAKAGAEAIYTFATHYKSIFETDCP